MQKIISKSYTNKLHHDSLLFHNYVFITFDSQWHDTQFHSHITGSEGMVRDRESGMQV